MGGTVSLRRLALWLAPPAVYEEFGPARPWQGAEIVSLWREAPWSEHAPVSSERLGEAFEAAIRELVKGHEVCAVSVSGGLDSLAVLVRLCRISEGTGLRVVGVCAEMTDDRGLSNVPVLERYCRDTVFCSAGAALREDVALVAPWLPGRARALAYLAAECPHLATASVPRLIGVRYRDTVQQWIDRWIEGLVSWHRDCHTDWAAMAAWDSMAGGRPIPTPGPIGWASPFETSRVRGAARAVALHYRYDGYAKFPYWRAKRLIVELFPERERHMLPHYKQTFAVELSRRERRRSVLGTGWSIRASLRGRRTRCSSRG